MYNGRGGFNGEGAIVRGRTILSARRSGSDDSYLTNSEHEDSSTSGHGHQNPVDPTLIPTYPYLQCVAYINKTHSQR